MAEKIALGEITIYGSYAIIGGERYPLYNSTKDLYRFGIEKREKLGIGIFSMRNNLSIVSPKTYPRFVFLVDLSHKIPVFLQLGKEFVAMTNGIFFVKNDEYESDGGYLYLKKWKGDLFKVVANTDFIRGKYYTDGERLWNAKHGSNPQNIMEKYLSKNDDFVYFEGKTKYVAINDGKYVIHNKPNRYYRIPIEEITTRIRFVVDDKTLWVPRYYKNFLMPQPSSGGWSTWW